MTDSLSLFKEWCQEAFRFLIETYGFTVVQEGRQYNSYYVLFGRVDLRLGVLGEGYGMVATIHYLTPAGIEVPYECVAADWQPFLGKRKKKRTPWPSQEDQIIQAARVIAEQHGDILAGDLSRVDAAAQRLLALEGKVRR